MGTRWCEARSSCTSGGHKTACAMVWACSLPEIHSTRAISVFIIKWVRGTPFFPMAQSTTAISLMIDRMATACSPSPRSTTSAILRMGPWRATAYGRTATGKSMLGSGRTTEHTDRAFTPHRRVTIRVITRLLRRIQPVRQARLWNLAVFQCRPIPGELRKWQASWKGCL